MCSDDNLKLWQFYIKNVVPIHKSMSLDISDINKLSSLEKASSFVEEQNILIEKLNLNHNDKKLISLHKHKVSNNNLLFKAEKNAKKRMKKGQFIFDAQIDLHGQTQEQAFDSLQKFITHNYRKKIRHLLIITGRGRYCYQNFESSGVLIKKVPEWLKNNPFSEMISVIEQASIYDGGVGALYIILRKI